MQIVVSGMGVVSGGGYSVEQNFATILTGISPMTESEEFSIVDSQGLKLSPTCGAAVGVTDGQRRFLRHVRLARFACEQALEDAEIDRGRLDRTHLYLCLQEPQRPGMDDRPQQLLARYLAKDLGLGDLPRRTRTISIGHAGMYWSIKAAMGELASGACQIAIIGAVDTYLDRITLQWLFNEKRLKSPGRAGGFNPSEAAGFIVLERADSASGRGAVFNAELMSPATAIEANSMYADTPCTGEGLSLCIRETLAVLERNGKNVGQVVCDLNGERYRAGEWGYAIPRAMGAIQNPYDVVHPADCLGDAGAASAAINLCYAVMALREGRVAGNTVLLWGSSDDGERGSVLMQAA